jgi:Fe2+ transport system protein B
MTALAAFGIPGTGEYLVIAVFLAVLAVLVALPVLLVFWIARKLLENSRENARLRLEVGKLADELERVRKQQQAR